MIISSFKEKEEKFLLSIFGYLLFGLSVSIDSLTTGIGFSAITDKSIKEIQDKYKNYTYGDFKKELANEIEKFIIPIQEKYKKYRYSKELINILKDGAKEANKLASKKIIEVRKKLGIKYDD